MTDMIIQLRDVGKIYNTGAGDFAALKGINLEVNQGEFLGIVGKSGAGKTTLLNMISGVSEISSGDVLFWPEKEGEPDCSLEEKGGRMLPERNLALGLAYLAIDSRKISM